MAVKSENCHETFLQALSTVLEQGWCYFVGDSGKNSQQELISLIKLDTPDYQINFASTFTVKIIVSFKIDMNENISQSYNREISVKYVAGKNDGNSHKEFTFKKDIATNNLKYVINEIMEKCNESDHGQEGRFLPVLENKDEKVVESTNLSDNSDNIPAIGSRGNNPDKVVVAEPMLMMPDGITTKKEGAVSISDSILIQSSPNDDAQNARNNEDSTKWLSNDENCEESLDQGLLGSTNLSDNSDNVPVIGSQGNNQEKVVKAEPMIMLPRVSGPTKICKEDGVPNGDAILSQSNDDAKINRNNESNTNLSSNDRNREESLDQGLLGSTNLSDNSDNVPVIGSQGNNQEKVVKAEPMIMLPRVSGPTKICKEDGVPNGDAILSQSNDDAKINRNNESNTNLSSNDRNREESLDQGLLGSTNLSDNSDNVPVIGSQGNNQEKVVKAEPMIMLPRVSGPTKICKEDGVPNGDAILSQSNDDAKINRNNESNTNLSSNDRNREESLDQGLLGSTNLSDNSDNVPVIGSQGNNQEKVVKAEPMIMLPRVSGPTKICKEDGVPNGDAILSQSNDDAKINRNNESNTNLSSNDRNREESLDQGLLGSTNLSDNSDNVPVIGSQGNNQEKVVKAEPMIMLPRVSGPTKICKEDGVPNGDAILSQSNDDAKINRNNESNTNLSSNDRNREESLDQGLQVSFLKDDSTNQSKIYSCKVCSKTFKTKNSLCSHNWKLHGMGTRPVVCDICYKIVAFSVLTEHKQIHRPRPRVKASPIACDQCGKSYKQKATLNMHIREIHIDSKLREKRLCKAKELRVRRNEKEKKDGRLHYCDQCDKSYSTRPCLISHRLTHTSSKQSPKQRYERAKQADESKRTCDVCSKVFCTVPKLKQHQQEVHTDTRDHKCSVCQERFKSRQLLQLHAAMHTGKLDCPLCDKTFKWKHSLDDHIRAHKGIRPYECDLCEASFIDNRALKTHTLKKHGIKIKGGISKNFGTARVKSSANP
jgi:hypothetical protein